ncbi:poly(a) RNA polymerase, mitochondrial [Plakobranchus ocellatus]|uniref:Poly(A) RNA polymerase, mitochondrial n=1 Tax=Plakobranchus ocellatus TaxID=259542 RepID=A0AAV4A064_9GAST|nr:poly(a) RNA polymerase, mitochondrial [Plakobranchus ocellatus]
MVELKSNDQAKKLGAIATFLDIPVTVTSVSPHKSLNSSKGVIRSRDLRCCPEEEMVEELSGVTHARRIKVRRGEDKIQTDTVVLTFDSPKPPSRIRAGYLTLDVRPYVPLLMRCYKCQRYGHGKDRCKKPAAVCVGCGKGGYVERDCSADPHCVNCREDHTASSKTCPKFLEEQAILRYKAENGGTFQQARKAVVVELHKTISTRTFASASLPLYPRSPCDGGGCKNPEEFLATYFCHFGLLAKISALGPAKNGVIRVQYMEEESVRRVLSSGPTHEHDGIKFQVLKFIYKPQMGDAMRLSQKEETSKQKVARTNLHANICELLGKTKSVEEGLQSVTENFQLSPQDFKDRAAIVRKLAEVFASHNPGCFVYQFGSSINGFGMRGCDLDLFLNLDLPHTISKKQLKELAKVLSSGSLSGSFKDILPIPSQRCPIIKFTHKPTGIKCDLSMDNKKALLNSRLLQLYSSDLRVKQVVFALRLWAKFRRLSKSEETWTQSLLSSYALTLLALFFLMVCKPCPVIPAVCDLEKFIPGIMVETVEECDCLVIPKGAQLPPSKNTQSSVELLQGLFKFYSQEIDFNHDALLLWDAKTVPRASLAQNSSYVNCRLVCTAGLFYCS